MTRQEELVQAARKEYPEWEEAQCHFIDGARWADAHNEGLNMHIKYLKEELIDKACEWLHTAIYLDYEHSIEHRYATLEELLNDFRKAMKGGAE